MERLATCACYCTYTAAFPPNSVEACGVEAVSQRGTQENGTISSLQTSLASGETNLRCCNWAAKLDSRLHGASIEAIEARSKEVNPCHVISLFDTNLQSCSCTSSIWFKMMKYCGLTMCVSLSELEL